MRALIQTVLLTIATFCLVGLLSGCIVDDGGALANRAEHTTAARVAYIGKSFGYYALMNSRGRTEIGPGAIVEATGDIKAASIVCPLYNGTKDAFFIAWLKDARGLEKGALTAAVAATVGPAMTGHAYEGRVYAAGKLVAPPNCDIPAMEDGTPVVVMPVKWNQSELPAVSREETRSHACPDGFVGVFVQHRTVNFRSDGGVERGEWQTADMGGCSEASSIKTEVTEDTPDVQWTVTGQTDVDATLAGLAPTKCTRAVVRQHQGGKIISEKTIETCDAAGLAPRRAIADPVGYNLRPVRPIPPEPICPSDSVVIPAYTNKADYRAAIAPYEAQLAALHPSCTMTVTSAAEWPLWASFNLEMAYNYRAITREYRTPLAMTWTGRGGEAAFAFSTRSPWTGVTYTRLEAVPDWFATDATHWIMLTVGADFQTGRVYTMDGRGYPPFIGPNTAPGLRRLTRFPIPYKNAGTDPWGNNAEQTARTHNFSYKAFGSRNYHLEGTYSVPPNDE